MSELKLFLKVETIGKVYMVVGGAPTKNDTHVKDVCMGILLTFPSRNLLPLLFEINQTVIFSFSSGSWIP
jgi:hypothetical protein